MAIIGISGKKRSGKDLVGQIIQYLTNDSGVKSFKVWQELNAGDGSSPFKIVKYADKLKDMVCLLIGCTREQLEDETFKNTLLSKEWERAVYYQDDKRVNQYTMLTGMFNERLEIPTPRMLLQEIGTDLFRNQFHPNTWINATMTNYRKSIDMTKKSHISDLPNWIITDVRFCNEAQAIKQKSGILIRINRSTIESDDNHESETDLDQYPNFDYIIKNDGNLDDLVYKVKEILIKEKMIKY